MPQLLDNTTWCGTDAEGFYSKALLTGETKSIINVVPDVKSKTKIASIDLTNTLSASDCTFTDNGGTTLGQKLLEVCPLKVNKEFCIRDFEVNYLSTKLRPGSNGDEIPTNFADYVKDQIALAVSADTEKLLWQGNISLSPADPLLNLCDGFIKKFKADANVVKVTGTTITAANVFAELAKVYAAIPDTIINRGKVGIFVSNKIARAYRAAIATANPLGGTFNAGDYTLNYLDIPMWIAPGLPGDVMVAAEPTNLWFGTDLMSDFEDIQLISLKNTIGVPTVRFVAEFKFGVEYGVSEEIVYYGN